MKLKLTIEEVMLRLNVDEIELTAREEAQDTSNNFREVQIYHRANWTDIRINQKEYREN